MTIKSKVLLSTLTFLSVSGGAMSSDLPVTKGEAVEYVKVCSAFGAGFFYIPGTDTCLKIGGEIRADYRVFGGIGTRNVGTPFFQLRESGLGRQDDRTAFNTQARVWFDARTETEWGLLRSYFQINADSHPIDYQGRTGVYNSNRFTIDKAYIQFGGLTAGYAHSFFGFYDNEYGDTIWAPYYAESSTVNLLAYTAEFGGGFKATLSIEDGRDHRYNNFSGAENGLSVLNGIVTSSGQAGQQIPDIVGQLRWDQDWGSLAVQGALHHSRTADSFSLQNPGDPTVYELPLNRGSKWGYAVGGTALVKLPFIDGGHFVVEGQYANAALEYLGVSNSYLGGAAGDAFMKIRPNGTIAAGWAKGWSIVAELGGNITPNLSANLVGSYIDTRAEGFQLPQWEFKSREYTIAGNLTYTIVKGFSVAGEVAYTNSKYQVLIPAATIKSDAWQAGVRLRRTF